MIKLLTLKTLAFFDFLYQKKLINFLKSNIPNINILIDVGAHKGETLNLFLKNFKINKIYSFEASPSTYKLLKKNIKNFLIDFPNTEIKIENLALGSSEKVISIKHLNESSSSTIKNINRDSKYFKKKFFFLGNSKTDQLYELHKVNQILLEKYYFENIKKDIDLIKIDTEGYEFEVLKGSIKILNFTKYILFEHHYDDMISKNYVFSDIHELLTANNFVRIYKSKMPFRKTFEYIYLNKGFSQN